MPGPSTGKTVAVRSDKAMVWNGNTFLKGLTDIAFNLTVDVDELSELGRYERAGFSKQIPNADVRITGRLINANTLKWITGQSSFNQTEVTQLFGNINVTANILDPDRARNLVIIGRELAVTSVEFTFAADGVATIGVSAIGDNRTVYKQSGLAYKAGLPAGASSPTTYSFPTNARDVLLVKDNNGVVYKEGTGAGTYSLTGSRGAYTQISIRWQGTPTSFDIFYVAATGTNADLLPVDPPAYSATEARDVRGFYVPVAIGLNTGTPPNPTTSYMGRLQSVTIRTNVRRDAVEELGTNKRLYVPPAQPDTVVEVASTVWDSELEEILQNTTTSTYFDAHTYTEPSFQVDVVAVVKNPYASGAPVFLRLHVPDVFLTAQPTTATLGRDITRNWTLRSRSGRIYVSES